MKKILLILTLSLASTPLCAMQNTTPLIEAARNNNAAEVARLIANGINLDSQDITGNTALTIAADNQFTNIITSLLEVGANPNIQNYDGDTALIIATIWGNEEIVNQLLKAGATLDIQNYESKTALMVAQAHNHSNVIKTLQSAISDAEKRKKKITILTNLIDIQSAQNNTSAINNLLAKYPNITKGELLLEAAFLGKINTLQYLLNLAEEERPSIDYIDNSNGFTPLLAAAQSGHEEIVTLLLNANADPDHQSVNQETALILAINSNHENIAQLLLNSGANVGFNDANDNTELIFAAYKGYADIVGQILQKEITSHYINFNNDSGQTALYRAAWIGYADITEMLIKANADPNKADNGGITPLHKAAWKGHAKIAQLLIEAGAKLDEADSQGFTPLILAARQGYTEIVQELLAANANPNIKDNNNQNALDAAREFNHEDTVELLQPVTSAPQACPREKKTRRRRRRKRTQAKVFSPSARTTISQLEPEPSPTPTPVPTLTPAQLAEQEKTANTRNLWELVGNGFAKQVESFLNNNKEFNAVQIKEPGETLLTYAVKLAIQEPEVTRRYQTVQNLLKNSDILEIINTPNKQGRPPRTIANRANNRSLVRLLAEYGAAPSSMHHSSPAAQEPAYDEEDDESDIAPTPTQSAPTTSVTDPLLAELKKGDRAKIDALERILHDNSRNLSGQRPGGTTPLMVAIESKVTEKVLRFILDKLTQENMRLIEVASKETALHKAIKISRVGFVKLLLEHKVPFEESDIGLTKVFLANAKQARQKGQAKRLKNIIQMLEKTQTQQQQGSILLQAAFAQDLKAIDTALDAGASINTQDEQGNTSLMRAIQQDNLSTAEHLIERKARLNIKNNAGETALILAASLNNYGLVDYLLKHGANEKISDNTGKTAYSYAIANTDIANRILTYKALQDLKQSRNITHVLRRHHDRTGNKTTAIIGDAGQDVQNNPYTGRLRNGSTTSFFPRSWTTDKIQKAIASVLEKPEKLDEQPARITEDNQVLRNALILRGTYQGVPIKVVISQTDDRHAPWKIFTAYPELRQN